MAYAAPEQLMGEALDGRADQYSFAATAYRLLTATRPFPHSNPAVVISHHLNADPPKLPPNRADLASLNPVMAVALAKNPNDRFTRCIDFARAFTGHAGREGGLDPTMPALIDAQQSTSAAKDAAVPTHTAPPKGDNPRRLQLAGAFVLVAIAVTAVALWRPWQHRYATSTASSVSGTVDVPSNQTAPPPPPTSSSMGLAPAAVDSLLLTPTEVNKLLKSPSDPLIEIKQTTYGMLNNTNLVTPQGCVGMVFTGERDVFASSGSQAMIDQSLEAPPQTYTYGLTSPSMPTKVQQTAVVFPSAEQAQAVLTHSQ